MKTTILNLINAQIAQEESYIKEHNQIKSILTQYEGQLINGKVLNKKRLSAFDVENGYTFELEQKFGMFHIIGKYRHLIGYDSEPIITVDKNDNSRGFVYFDACSGSAALERINQLKGLDVDKLTKIAQQIKDNFDGLCTAFGDMERNNFGSFHNPIFYEIMWSIHPNNENGRGIKLSDFYYIKK